MFTRINLCLVFFVATCAAEAQIYKCKGPDGKISFADQPCPGERPRVPAAPKTAAKPAAATSSGPGISKVEIPAAMRAEILSRWKMTDAQLSRMERDCAQGSNYWCDLVETYKSKSPSQVLSDELVEFVKKCESGDTSACQVVAGMKRADDSIRNACKAGDREACKAAELLR